MERFLWLEWMNAYIIGISLAMMVTFCYILWKDRGHYKDTYYGALIGICVYHTGELARQTWYWGWGHFFSRDPFSLSGKSIALLFLFGLILSVGAACQIRVFTESRFGQWPWKLGLLAAVVLATVLVYLPRFP